MQCNAMWCDECANAKYVALNFSASKKVMLKNEEDGNPTQQNNNKSQCKSKAKQFLRNEVVRSAKTLACQEGRGRATRWNQSKFMTIKLKVCGFCCCYFSPSAPQVMRERWKICKAVVILCSACLFLLYIGKYKYFIYFAEMQMTWPAALISVDESN